MADNTQVNIDLALKLQHKAQLKQFEGDIKVAVANIMAEAKKAQTAMLTQSKMDLAQQKAMSNEKIALIKKETAEVNQSSKLATLEYKKQKDEEKRLAKQSADEKKQVDRQKLESEKAWRKEEIQIAKSTEEQKRQITKQINDQIKRDNELTARVQQRQMQNSFKQPSPTVTGKSTYIGEMFSKDYYTAQLRGYTQLMNSVSQGNPKWAEYKAKVDLTKSSLQSYNSVKKLSIFQIAEFGENLTVVTAGIMAALGGITSLAKESVTLAAKFNVLRANFKGTEEDLQLFRQATAGTVTDANLIKLSNQAQDLGISLKDQSLLFSLAEDAADKYGGSVEENFQRVVMTTEGNIKGLKALGIQKAEYEQMVQTLVKAHGGEVESIQGVNGEREISIKNLDAETQKQIRLEALLKLTGITLDDVKNKTQDQADKLEAIGVRVEEAKTKFGSFLMGGIEPLISGFLKLGDAGAVIIGGFGSMASSAIPLISALAQIKIAFPALFASMGPVGLALLGLSATMLFIGATTEDKVVPNFQQLNDEVDKSKQSISDLTNIVSNYGKELPVEEQELYNKKIQELTEKFPGLISGYDAKTGKAIIDKKGLEDLIALEEEHLRLLEEKRQAELQLGVNEAIRKANVEYNDYQNTLKEILDLLQKIENADAFEQDVKVSQWTAQVEDLNLKLKTLPNSVENLKVYFENLIKTSYKLGNTEQILNFIKTQINGNVNATDAFTAAMRSLAAQSAIEWNKVAVIIANNAEITGRFASALIKLKQALTGGLLGSFLLPGALMEIQGVINDAKNIGNKTPDTTAPNYGSKGSSTNSRDEKDIKTEIDRLEKEIADKKAEQNVLISKGLEGSIAYRNILDEILEKEKELARLKETYTPFNQKNVSLTAPLIPQDTNPIREYPDFELMSNALNAEKMRILGEEGDKALQKIKPLADVFNMVGQAFGDMIGKFIQGENIVDSLKELFKSILNTLIDFVQGMYFAAVAKTFADSILSFGATLLKELPELALVTGAIGALRGLVASFAQGGYVSGAGTSTSDSIPAMLSNGEFVVNAASTRSNLPLLSAINNNANFTPAMATPVNNVYIYSEIDGVTFLKKNFPKYKGSRRAVKLA